MGADLTEAVLASFAGTSDPRLRQILQAATRHLHAFIAEIQPTEAEWQAGIAFLTAIGQKCDDNRQEFILLSDTMGVSMLMDGINHAARAAGATESTVLGPFHRLDAPMLPYGGNIASLDQSAMPVLVGGRVLDAAGSPIADAELDVWQTGSNGLYDSQDPALAGVHMRGRFHTDRDGRYLIRTTRPVHYPIPADGPVGELLKATSRHPWRPAHIHVRVSSPDHEPVTTHVFDADDPYLRSDAVFAVKESLVRRFEVCDRETDASRAAQVSPPYLRVSFDFMLAATGAAPEA